MTGLAAAAVVLVVDTESHTLPADNLAAVVPADRNIADSKQPALGHFADDLQFHKLHYFTTINNVETFIRARHY